MNLEFQTRRRRWTGGIILGTAVAMLLLGQTWLKPYLDGLGYVIYWLVCATLTFIALMFAFVDLHAVRRRSRDQQRELIQDALEGLPQVPGAGDRRAKGEKPNAE